MGKNTVENLKEAFAGESQANRRYLAFAKESRRGRISSGRSDFSEQRQRQRPFMPTTTFAS